MGATESGRVSRKRVEQLLEAALVPVEPDRQFVSRLKARLVHYSGEGMSPFWAMAAGLAVATLLVVTSLALSLRLLLSILNLLAGDGRNRSTTLSGGSSAA